MLEKIKNSAIFFKNKIKNALGFKDREPNSLSGQKGSRAVSDLVDQILLEASAFEESFYEQPSLAILNEAIESFEKVLRIDPKNWQGLHKFLNLCTTSGHARKGLLLNERIISLKREIQKQYDLDGLGITVLPAGYGKAIGNLAILDLIIKAQRLGLLEPSRLILPARPGQSANESLLKILSKHIKVVRQDAGIAAVKDFEGYGEVGGAIVLNSKTRHFWEASHTIQKEWERQKLAPIFSDSEEGQRNALDYLKKFGFRDGDWYVCLHVRTAEKYDDEWSLRNANINHYYPAIKRIVESGGWVIRMGGPELAGIPQIDRSIDFAKSADRSECLDISLIAGCRFFFGTASGLAHVATMFGKPSLLTNWMPWGIMPWGSRDLIIPKLLRDRASGRILTAEESLSEPIGFIQDERHMRIHNIEALENNEEELSDGVEEMLSAIKLHQEGKMTLGRYQAMFQETERQIGICNSSGRLCETFGAKHPELWVCSQKRQK